MHEDIECAMGIFMVLSWVLFVGIGIPLSCREHAQVMKDQREHYARLREEQAERHAELDREFAWMKGGER